MKKKMVSILLAAAIISAAAVSAPAAWAAEAEATEAPAEQAAEGAEQEAKVIEDVKVTLESGEVTIKNETEKNYTAEYKKAEAAEQKEGEAAAEETWNLVLTDEEGNAHTFEKAAPDQWTEPSVAEEYGFLYVKYKDAGGKEQEALETAEEKAFEQEITMYASADVNIRKEASTDAEALKVAALGTECKATASVPGWIKVEADGVSGYVFHSYITEDKEKVDALVQEKKAAAEAAAQAAAAQQAAAAEAAAAQQAAAAAAQAPAAEPAAPAQEPAAPAAPVEVSRQAFDDCDGSGHGFWEITYSDGSVAYEEY